MSSTPTAPAQPAPAFERRLAASRASREFAVYQRVRDRVLAMLEEAAVVQGAPSEFWADELAAFAYMLDASPLIVERLREHCYHLTGLRSFDYRHAGLRRRQVQRTLERLGALDARKVFVPESPALGGFGYAIDGHLVNVDTLRYYEAMMALDRSGQLDQFRSGGARRQVLEIGGGWGGFAYQFKTLFPNTTYVIIDLPQTLLFSATYLSCLFPSARVAIYGDATPAGPSGSDYDFVFLPHYAVDRIRAGQFRLDLAVNMASFQEMTERQVDDYAGALAQAGCPALFTANREHSPHNPEMGRLEPVLARHFDVREIKGPRIAVDMGGLLTRLRYWSNSPHAYRYLLAGRRAGS